MASVASGAGRGTKPTGLALHLPRKARMLRPGAGDGVSCKPLPPLPRPAEFQQELCVSHVSETDQIARAAAGDRQAQAALVNRHMPAAYALARRMLRNDAEAEDVTQEAFLRAWKALPGWEPRAKFSTWIYRVTLNLCRDRLRKHHETAMAEPPDLEDWALKPDEVLDQTQRLKRLQAALDGLPDRQRAVIHLCALEGRTNIEAAEIMDISIEAVESLLARARRKLRNTIIQGGSE